MGSRAKWLLFAMTVLAAVLTAATFAYAVDQQPKNGCSSPEAYSGSLTSPTFATNPDGDTIFAFQGWFEIESIAPGSFDRMTVEYSLDPGISQEPRTWVPFDDLMTQSTPAEPGGPDHPYSNKGTDVAPQFQSYSFTLPNETVNQTGVQVRLRFDTGDATYQGFRGLGVDAVSISGGALAITQTFESGPAGWSLEGPSGPGGPFWQILQNPQSVSVKNPEVNPNLVTLPDPGSLPAAFEGSRIAWFGNTDSGTFCGPDFASFDQAPDTVITGGPSGSTADENPTFSFTSNEQAF